MLSNVLEEVDIDCGRPYIMLVFEMISVLSQQIRFILKGNIFLLYPQLSVLTSFE